MHPFPGITCFDSQRTLIGFPTSPATPLLSGVKHLHGTAHIKRASPYSNDRHHHPLFRYVHTIPILTSATKSLVDPSPKATVQIKGEKERVGASHGELGDKEHKARMATPSNGNLRNATSHIDVLNARCYCSVIEGLFHSRHLFNQAPCAFHPLLPFP